MTTDWQWVSSDVAQAIHEEQLVQHGGGSGVRDISLLESALAKPEQLAHYGTPDVFDLAAAYAFGISRNHPFIDGNKRTGWVIARLFLLLHGFDRSASDEQCYIAMLKLAEGSSTQDEFSQWLRTHTKALA